MLKYILQTLLLLDSSFSPVVFNSVHGEKKITVSVSFFLIKKFNGFSEMASMFC